MLHSKKLIILKTVTYKNAARYPEITDSNALISKLPRLINPSIIETTIEITNNNHFVPESNTLIRFNLAPHITKFILQT